MSVTEGAGLPPPPLNAPAAAYALGATRSLMINTRCAWAPRGTKEQRAAGILSVTHPPSPIQHHPGLGTSPDQRERRLRWQCTQAWVWPQK
jgi:hypothetical protein